ncbi:MAG: hypothetical protein ABI614_00710, partial [Planctomycetota bacterium]
MQCAKFEQRLQQLLDDRQNVEQDDMLREHARVCEDCRGILRMQGQLFAGLRTIPEPNFAHEMGLRVLDHLQIDRRKRNNKRLLAIALAVAAAVMIALLPLAGDHVRFRQKGANGGGALAIATTPPRPTETRRLTEQEAEDIRLVMHQLMLRLSDQQIAMFEPVDQLANGIRPLA